MVHMREGYTQKLFKTEVETCEYLEKIAADLGARLKQLERVQT